VFQPMLDVKPGQEMQAVLQFLDYSASLHRVLSIACAPELPAPVRLFLLTRTRFCRPALTFVFYTMTETADKLE
jgi:hypothetical protein